MASSNAPRTYEFLTVIPDKPGMAPKRMEFRSEHYKGLTPRIDSGEWKTGGAILHSVPKDDEASSLDFAGSSIVIVAESKEQVLKELSNDIYARSGVWDMEKIQIFPYYCAFRNP